MSGSIQGKSKPIQTPEERSIVGRRPALAHRADSTLQNRAELSSGAQGCDAGQVEILGSDRDGYYERGMRALSQITKYDSDSTARVLPADAGC